MERAGGAKKLMILVAMVALVYGSAVAETQPNFNKKCIFSASLCIVKCLGKCVMVPDSPTNAAVFKVTADINKENPVTCVTHCVESKCHISIPPPPPEIPIPQPPPEEGDEPEPAPASDKLELAAETETAEFKTPPQDFGKVEALDVDSCSDKLVGSSC